MIFGVAKIDEVLIVSVHMAHTLWVMKAGIFELSIYEPDISLAIAHDIDALKSLSVDNDDSVIASVRNDEQWVLNTLLPFDADDFAWKPQVLRIGCL